MNIKLESYNIKVDKSQEALLASKFQKESIPEFVSYQEDIENLRQALKGYLNLDNLIVVGSGGSITSFFAYLGILESAKEVRILDTVEPDIIQKLIKEFSPKDTLVIHISKSGNTISSIENALYFSNLKYRSMIITEDKLSALCQIAKQKAWPTIHHASIGGRYSGRTASGYAPAIFCNLAVEKIDQGARTFFDKSALLTGKTDSALTFSLALFDLENKGNCEIFLPIYSHYLYAFAPLVVQLIHESFAKDGKGLSVLAAVAPESQHHTNQRFFGGPRNMIGVFMTLERSRIVSKIKVPNNLRDISFKTEKLAIFNHLSLTDALSFEAQSTIQDAIESKIPILAIKVKQRTPEAVGEILAFWQLAAYYSAKLRGVDPFDQPQVEHSKEITFNLIKNQLKLR